MRAVASAGTGEVRASHASSVSEAVTGKAGCGREHLATVFKVPVFHSCLGCSAELVECPHRRGASREDSSHVFDSGFHFWLFRDELGVSLFLGISEGGKAVGFDELDKLREAGSATIVGGFEKPVQLLLAQFGSPACFEVANAAGVFHLWLLALCIGNEGHTLGRRVRSLKKGERLGKHPVQLEASCRIGGVKLRDDLVDGCLVRVSETVQGHLKSAEMSQLLAFVQLREINLEE